MYTLNGVIKLIRLKLLSLYNEKNNSDLYLSFYYDFL